MTARPFPTTLKLNWCAIAVIVASPVLAKPPMASPGSPRPPVSQTSRTGYPDPRYRAPVNFAELQAVANQVAKASNRTSKWQLALGKDPGPLARIVVKPDQSTIYLHPVAAKVLPPNTWAFIFGHEFAHDIKGLEYRGPDNPDIELQADIAGARYAMAAGYRIEAFLGWVLTEPNTRSESHGSLHDRVWLIAEHFRIPKNVIRAEAKKYSKKN